MSKMDMEGRAILRLLDGEGVGVPPYEEGVSMSERFKVLARSGHIRFLSDATGIVGFNISKKGWDALA